ncbi:Phage protein [plant metagenome]|uniref:Phage protein n=1 Tax=plant metagenome TaxID=1297885 RepID=A0A484TIQ9_9ZZZZ
MQAETYYFGQGRLLSRPAGTAGRGGWRWWGDVSALTWAPTSETVRHRESYSGQKGTVRKFNFLNECPINGTLHQLDAVNLATLLNGTVTTIAGGSVAGESLGSVAVGDLFRLDHPGVSALVITDSAGTPTTVYSQAAPNANFDVDPRFGALECLALPTPAPTMPLLAAYTYAAAKQVAFLNAVPPTLALRYEGINLAEGGAPVVVEWYRVSSSLLQQWALITSGTDVAGTEFSLEALLDSSKSPAGALGQFGRFVALEG